jgi:cellulose synthase operon protein C
MSCCALRVVAVVGLLLSLPAGRADDNPSRTVLSGESAATAQRLRTARKLAAEQQFAAAIDEYQALLAEAGDRLVPLAVLADGNDKALARLHCLQARWLCHLDLTALPAEGRKVYRNRVDAQARKWLEQGAADRDPGPLRRVVDEAFCSSVGDQALDLLGDLAFERGDFDEAHRWWRRLTLPAAEVVAAQPRRPLELLFPDPQIDLARVRAKLILARLFQGEPAANLQPDLEAFRKLHEKAEGNLAGRKGNYAAILQTLMDPAAAVIGPAEAPAWSTFAGDPARNLVLPAAPDDPNRLLRLCRHGPQWRFSLQTQALLPAEDARPPASADRVLSVSALSRALAFHPVIADNQVLVADAQRVVAYDVTAGRSTVWFDLAQSDRSAKASLTLPARPDLRYTLTVAGDCVYARLGVQEIGPVGRPDERPGDLKLGPSYLVCLRTKADATGNRVRWRIKPEVPEQGSAVFEGAPVVHEGRVYVAVTRLTPTQTITAIHCYPAEAADRGALWRVEVSETPEMKAGEQRYRQHLLTLAAGNVVYCTHTGAIVALDALSGRRVWAVRYPSRGLGTAADQPSPRDLTPALCAGGRLYAAPADYDRLLCLDPATGNLLWERDKIEAVHLLGVGQGRLIFTTPQGIRAVNAATGSDRGGWQQPADGSSLMTFGRGFLAGDLVFWPTQRGLEPDGFGVYVLQQKDGEQPADLIPGPLRKVRPGNMTCADGCLAVADAETLSIYLAPGLLLRQRETEVQGSPQAALPLYRLGLAEADAGQADRAVEHLRHAEGRAAPGECFDWVRLDEQARSRRHELLLERAKTAGAGKRWDEAAALLAEAQGKEFPVPARLAAITRQADLWTAADKPERVAATWQGILADETLRRATLTDGHGNPQSARVAAVNAITALTRAHGVSVSAQSEEQARTLLGSAREANRVAVLERLAEEFPLAAATGPALLELARLREQAGQQAAAARACRLFLRHQPQSAERPRALVELARCYERQRCWEAARLMWQRLAEEAGDRTLAELDGEHTVREYVARQLRQPEYVARRTSAHPAVALPLTRSWQADLAPKEHLLVPAGPNIADGLLFFADGPNLLCRDTGGPLRWRQTLSHDPLWLARHADTVLAAGPGGVACLSAGDGALIWSLAVSGLSEFQLAGSRLFCLEEERRLLAVDAETGQVMWTRAAPAAELALPFPGGRIFRGYHAAEAGVVVQTSGGKLWDLDSRTGQLRQELETSREPWPCLPLAVDSDRLCVAVDRQTVILLDTAAGKELWRYRVGAESTLAGQKLWLAGGKDVLLLLIPRNYGPTLLRLGVATGEPLWPEERPLGTEHVAVESVSVDHSAVYFTAGRALSALALTDGKPQWSVPLPESGGDWRTLRTGEYLAVYPAEGGRDWRLGGPFGSLRLTWPATTVPVLFYDPQTGQLVQRVNCGGRRESTARLRRWEWEGLWPPTVETRRAQVTVQVLERGVAAGMDGTVWVRTAGKPE